MDPKGSDEQLPQKRVAYEREFVGPTLKKKDSGEARGCHRSPRLGIS